MLPFPSYGAKVSRPGFGTIDKDRGSNASRVHFGWFGDRSSREEGAMMIIVVCGFHPSYQQIAFLDTESGKLVKGV